MFLFLTISDWFQPSHPAPIFSDFHFELVATIEHRGSMESGHFVSHLRVKPDAYYIFNDMVKTMKKSSKKDVESSNFFFYRRIYENFMFEI